MTSSTARLETLRALRTSFPDFASQCLRIKTKSGEIKPFVLNRAQIYIHSRLEAQKAEIGFVRALLLKGRQQGASTYIGGRFYHRTSLNRGVNAFILTHEQDATDNLFRMVSRYHDNNWLAPQTGAANAKELNFPRLDSGYTVGTAGTKAVGRSKTILLLHGSEAAFWPHADTHFAGVVQAVPNEPGSEVIIESTANGVGGEFHGRWQQAEAGIGDYQAIFVPWYWQDEYRRPVPDGFGLSPEEQAYFEAYGANGLTLEHMVWRRAKIAELKDDMLFKQEYPATAAEAFQMTGHDGFIKAEAVVRARKASLEGVGPLILGVDPKRFGNDRFSIAARRGRKVLYVKSRDEKFDGERGARWVKEIIDADHPKRVFIDVGGVGAAVYDFLNAWGYAFDPSTPDDPKKVVVPIDFAGSPEQPDIVLPSGEVRPGPLNRRAEIWMRSRDWLDEPGGADIPDVDSLQADACGPEYHYNTNSYLLIESKEHMRDIRKVRSPDEWDAVALTFAESVASGYVPTAPHRDMRSFV